MQPVDIFMWRDLLERGLRIEAVGQGQLQQDPVDARIVRERRDSPVQIGLGDVLKMLDSGFEADVFRGPVFAPDVRRRGRVVTDLDDGDTGTTLVRVALDGASQLLADRERVSAAVDQSGWHGAEFSQTVG